MKIILVRHTKAQNRIKALLHRTSDEVRPLTKKGILKFTELVSKNKKLFLDTDLFVTSQYLRAIETLDIILEISGRGANEKLVLKGITPDDAPEFLLKWFFTRKEKKIIIVSHEPFITNFLKKAFKGKWPEQKIRKGAFIFLEFDSATESYKLLKLVQPKQEKTKSK